MATLTIVQGPEAGKCCPLDRDTTVIGRLTSAEVVLDSPAVSRKHARILRREGQFFAEDLGSSNGTFLNGQKLTRPTALTAGSILQVGPVAFAFSPDQPVAAAAVSDVPVRERVPADPSSADLRGTDPAHQLQVVLQVTRQLGGTLDRGELLGKVLDQLLHLFPQARSGAALLCEGKDLVPGAARSRPGAPGRELPRPARTALRRALDEGAGLLVESSADDPGLAVARSLSEGAPSSLMCVPLIGQDGRRLGALQLEPGPFGTFAVEDLRLLTAIALQVSALVENAALHAELILQAGDGAAGPPAAHSTAFSSHAIVTRYPAPIALAYRRFCRQQDSATRLRMLFAALEATLRYLVTLGICDLFRGLAEAGGEVQLPEHAAFDFLRRPRPMSLGLWAEALRETARALAGQEGRVVRELPEVCAPGGDLDARVLAGLIRTRNECFHEEGNLTLTPEECQGVLREVRPRLEEALQHLHFVCAYPLGFVQRSPGGGGDRYYLHACMGAHVANTVEAHAVEAPVPLRENVPFVVSPDDARLLYLWPLLCQRATAHTGRHTLYVFEGIPDRRGAFLAEVRHAAIDVRDEWRQALREPAADHGWLLERLRELPAAPTLPPALRLGRRLQPASGGRLVGRMLGTNRLLAVAATGGFSTVYAAENTATGERVAVKVLEAPESQRHLARFRQEFDKLQRAGQHLHVIRCLEWGNPILDGREYPWYSMEFALGGDLAGRIEERQGECPVGTPWDRPDLRAQIVGEFRAIAGAVAHLHGLGIVHRDIKPGNVLIMGDGQLRLTDFGLVKDLEPVGQTIMMGPRTSTGAVLGTRHYMAPEQERGEEVEKPADVYALGVLLAELAVGRRPAPVPYVREGSTLAGARALEQLPEGLRRLILRCTDVAPERRPPDGQAVLGEFARLVQGEAS